MIFYFFQLPKVIYWHDVNTCEGKVPVDQLHYVTIFDHIVPPVQYAITIGHCS